MIFETKKNTLKAKFIGYRLNEGEYNNIRYHNYIVTLAQAVEPEKGAGIQCVEMTLPDTFDPDEYYNKNVAVSFRFYRDAKRQRIDDIDII